MHSQHQFHPGPLRRLGLALAAALLTLTAADAARADCAVTYSITSQWNPGFGTSITIKNTGATPVNGWTLGWTFASGQKVTQLWNGVVTQVGAQVSVKDAGYNSTIPASGSVSVGFNGTWSGTNSVPTSFTLNGAVCGGGTATTYTLAVATTGTGSTAPAAGTYSYASGTTVSVTAIPAVGATVTGRSGAATGTANPVSIGMSANCTPPGARNDTPDRHDSIWRSSCSSFSERDHRPHHGDRPWKRREPANRRGPRRAREDRTRSWAPTPL